jgi:RNA polymerase sigma factor for flagellar operon FliA
MKKYVSPASEPNRQEIVDPPSGTQPVSRPLRPPVSSDDLLAYMHLVRMTVAGFVKRVPPSVQRDDLVASGTIGLMDALAKHAGARGAAFEWYARVRIRGAILDELRRQDWLSRRARARACDPAGGAVLPTIVAVDDLRGPPNALEACDVDLVERHSERAALSRAVARLPARERSVIEMHYVLGIQFKEIAETFGVSLPRVSQLHARAISMLRELLQADDGPAWTTA